MTTMTATRGRQALVALTSALLLVVGMAGQALAQAETQQFRFNGESGFAAWSLDDDRNTSVYVSGMEGQFHYDSGEPQRAEDVFVGVFQRYCDEDADELVLRSYFGWDDASVHIPDGLPHGSADGEVVLDGTEWRSDDCDQFPSFPPEDTKDLGEVPLEVAADWEGVGELDTSPGKFHFDGEGFKYRSHDVLAYRDAEVSASLSGLDELGLPTELDDADFAGLASFKDSTVYIDHPE